jgi:2,4-dienoyl-CoA reductase-like NADH-dependent reductase (Old Yellow Enzyme family)
MARELLRNPHWPLFAAHELGERPGEAVAWPEQYQRAAYR